MSNIKNKTLDDLNRLTNKIIGCAINDHKRLGSGLLESIYEKALCIEFEFAGLNYEVQKVLKLNYRGRFIGEYRMDIVVEDAVVLELKCVENMNPVFDAQILSYMKLGGLKLGLLINFNKQLLKDGVKRFIV